MQAVWILSRGNTLYYYLSLDGVPVGDWLSAVDLAITERSPYARTGRYIVYGAAAAMVWIWNRDLVEQQLLEHQLSLDTPIVPESLYYAQGNEAVRLLETRDGFELQVWDNKELIESIYWTNLPDARQLKIVQANFPMLEPASLNSVILQFDDNPWGKNRAQQEIKLSRPVLTGLLFMGAIYFIALSWQLVNVVTVMLATHGLQKEAANYKSQITGIIEAREAAFRDIERVNFLNAQLNSLDQTRIIAAVFEKIPRNGVVLQRWVYQAGELTLILKGSNFDPRYYVQAFEAIPFVSSVSAQPDQSAGILTLKANVIESGNKSADIIQP